jgi:hypothetical protein
VQWAVSGVVAGIGDAFGGIQDLGRLREENRRLTLEVDDLRARVVRLQEAEIGIAACERSWGSSRPIQPMISCRRRWWAEIRPTTSNTCRWTKAQRMG